MVQQDPAPRSDAERSASVRDHLANERTLLAWQRTALALIGLGFVVDRFAFEGRPDDATGTFLGLALIVGGGLTAVVGAWRFVRTEHEIDTQSYRPALTAHLVLAAAITLGAIATGLYLLTSR
jgi:putative membrane protein